jgi:hypothetical protein
MPSSEVAPGPVPWTGALSEISVLPKACLGPGVDTKDTAEYKPKGLFLHVMAQAMATGRIKKRWFALSLIILTTQALYLLKGAVWLGFLTDIACLGTGRREPAGINLNPNDWRKTSYTQVADYVFIFLTLAMWPCLFLLGFAHLSGFSEAFYARMMFRTFFTAGETKEGKGCCTRFAPHTGAPKKMLLRIFAGLIELQIAFIFPCVVFTGISIGLKILDFTDFLTVAVLATYMMQVDVNALAFLTETGRTTETVLVVGKAAHAAAQKTPQKVTLFNAAASAGLIFTFMYYIHYWLIWSFTAMGLGTFLILEMSWRPKGKSRNPTKKQFWDKVTVFLFLAHLFWFGALSSIHYQSFYLNKPDGWSTGECGDYAGGGIFADTEKYWYTNPPAPVVSATAGLSADAQSTVENAVADAIAGGATEEEVQQGLNNLAPGLGDAVADAANSG